MSLWRRCESGGRRGSRDGGSGGYEGGVVMGGVMVVVAVTKAMVVSTEVTVVVVTVDMLATLAITRGEVVILVVVKSFSGYILSVLHVPLVYVLYEVQNGFLFLMLY